MNFNRKQQSALVLAGLLLIISVLQFGETVSAVSLQSEDLRSLSNSERFMRLPSSNVLVP